MTEHDEAIDHYWSFNPRLFPILDRLELYQRTNEGSPAYVLSLKLWFRASENESDDPRRLYLSFNNVSELKVNPHGFFQIPILEITSMKGYQWEGINYRVADTEEDQLSFYCKEFEVDVVHKDEMP